jgi:hypothetical protein
MGLTSLQMIETLNKVLVDAQHLGLIGTCEPTTFRSLPQQFGPAAFKHGSDPSETKLQPGGQDPSDKEFTERKPRQATLRRPHPSRELIQAVENELTKRYNYLMDPKTGPPFVSLRIQALTKSPRPPCHDDSSHYA